MLTPESSVSRLIVNDTADMILLDGTRDLSRQKIGILIRLKDSYNLTDFTGLYNAQAFDYSTSPVITAYRTHALQITSNGSGGLTTTAYTNNNGVLFPPPPYTFSSNYTFATYGSPFLTFSSGPDVGSVSANGNVVTLVQRGSNVPGQNFRFGFYVGLKREARTYSNADLAGKWITVGFGEAQQGAAVLSLVRALHCDPTGVCSSARKLQMNGQTDYFSTASYFNLSIGSDGTFGQSFGSSYPPYAAAIGNNGNTLYFNPSFDPIPGAWLEIGLRCADCAIPMETNLPLILRN
jgi:hypothetical protein